MVGTSTRKHPTSRQIYFAQLIASGKTHAYSFAQAYQSKLKGSQLTDHAARVLRNPRVVEEIARLRAKSERKHLLSLNDRLEILADIATDPENKPTDKSRAIEVYSKISGDQAPERHEIAGKDGAPIHLAVTATVTRLSVKDRIAALREARKNEATQL